MKSKSKNYGSIITGIILGFLIGYYLNLTLPIFNFSKIVYIGASSGLFYLLAYKKPVFTEYLAYALPFLIMFNFLWDFAVGDRNVTRWTLFLISFGVVIVNSLTGKIRLFGAKKTLKKAVGL